jgi:hypothetical protein
MLFNFLGEACYEKSFTLLHLAVILGSICSHGFTCFLRRRLLASKAAAVTPLQINRPKMILLRIAKQQLQFLSPSRIINTR